MPAQNKIPEILIIVPAYNAAPFIRELYQKITRYFPPRNILFVNDGSTDKSYEILEDLDCHTITFETNRGKGAALRAGFAFAVDRGYDAVITMDADLQHRPEHLPDFLARYHEADILVGTRTMDPGQMPVDRRLTNNFTSLIISIFGAATVRDSQSGYRLLKKTVLRRIRLKSSRYDTESEILHQACRCGFRVAEVPIDTVYEGSRSYIHPWRDTGRFIRQLWRRLWY